MVVDKSESVGAAPAQAHSESGASSKDLFAASFLITAAAVLIAALDPINIGFTAFPLATLVLNAVGIALVWSGVLRLNRTLLYSGVGALLALMLIESVSQPAVLSAPVAVIWPLRLMIVVVVALVWVILMQPRVWIRRGMFALTLPTLLILLLWGGPGLGTVFFGWKAPVPVTNFAPIWLAVDSQDNVYATDFSGNLIWVFDSSGAPTGSLRPDLAPNPGTPGPGILPNGMADEMVKGGALPSPAPLPDKHEIEEGSGEISLCGIAVDSQDNIYTIVTQGAAPFSVKKFDRNGSIQGKYPLPTDFNPGVGCLAVDDNNIFVTSRTGDLLIMDRAGKTLLKTTVPFQPVGIASNGKGQLIAIDVRSIAVVDVATGKATSAEQTELPDSLFQALALEPDGAILLSDSAHNRIVRVNPLTRQVIATLGSVGDAPGQFRGPAGIALDKEGRIYVADWQHRVIERFTSSGQIDALLWAAHNGENEPTPTGGNIH